MSAKAASKTVRPVQLVVNSSGLKIPGEGDWLEETHQTKRKRRSWRKLHLGLDLVSGEIVCFDLTTDDIGDPTALPGLLDQIDGPVDLFLAPSQRCKHRLPGNGRSLGWRANMRCCYRTLRVDDQSPDPTTQERGPEPRRCPESEHS